MSLRGCERQDCQAEGAGHIYLHEWDTLPFFYAWAVAAVSPTPVPVILNRRQSFRTGERRFDVIAASEVRRANFSGRN